MVYTVWNAFNQFRQTTVDLDLEVVRIARTSRDYLFEQIKKLNKNNAGFPRLEGSFLCFGSFARKAKTRPLDDIDLLILLDGTGLQVQPVETSIYTFRLQLSSHSASLAPFADDYGYINSTKILNNLKVHLAQVNSYQQAGLKKSMQAVVLSLKSYPWVYDIVPAVPVNGYNVSSSYYLIPDGAGNWIKTDPRTDSRNITEVNLKHQGKFLPTLRLLKYWNSRSHKPRLASYYFETLAIKVFRSAATIDDYPKAIKYFFDCCPSFFMFSCPDPKNLGANLDATVSLEIKAKVVKSMHEASWLTGQALRYEDKSEPKEAIASWQQVFGTKFPSYG